MNAPEVDIDLQEFWKDPYPSLARMRKHAPICFVPQLNATLLALRDDIFVCEKNVDVFSSDQPDGLMTQLMGQNMMRKDGADHLKERRDILPSVSPRAVKETWIAQFKADTEQVLEDLAGRSKLDIVKDFAMPVSANALRHITGLTRMTPAEMDSVSQGMIDGIANYSQNPEIEQRCTQSTQLIDDNIDTMLQAAAATPSASILSVLVHAQQPMDSIRANIKLAISGGQNEPRDAIAGAVWALLTHPDQLQLINNNQASWLQVFEEYARWNSPIGMSPRRIAKHFSYKNIDLKPDSRAFLMFGSANRDESVFENAEAFNITRDTSKAISFGAGPHFCAGAAASRALIADVALPMLFKRFPNMALESEVTMSGWAFRGPLSVPVLT
jgi:cytochrome P450